MVKDYFQEIFFCQLNIFYILRKYTAWLTRHNVRFVIYSAH